MLLPPLAFAWPYEMLVCMCNIFPPLNIECKKRGLPVYKLLKKTSSSVNSPLLWLACALFLRSSVVWFLVILQNIICYHGY